LTKQERNELNSLIDGYKPPIWEPLEGPQTDALNCEADILFYGGAAGGGKTDLALGLALTQHIKSIILRKEATQLTGVIDRLTSIMGGRDGFNGQDKIWRFPDGKQLEFGSIPHEGAQEKYQGRPHDLIVFDEAVHFLESWVRFVMGWLRNAEHPDQRCRVVLTGNPPTDSQGDWIIRFFAPWLDNKHPKPAAPGELRWYATVKGEDMEVPSCEPFVLDGVERIYDFDSDEYTPEEIITPMSRTFIPAKVTDNPYLAGSGYLTTLQGMPEPLRSQMLYGDFSAGRTDGEWQAIPTKWVDAAMERWKEEPPCEMDAMGVDPNRGGEDKMILTPRHGYWIGEQVSYGGHEVPDGQTGASLVIRNLMQGAIPCVDMIGYGASTFDHLSTFNVPALPLNGSESDHRTDFTGLLKFVNLRAYWIWRMRDLLDPRNGINIHLPPDPELKADLCAYEYKLTPRGVQIEDKKAMKKRLGRSPDKGDSCIYAFAEDVEHLRDWDDDEYNEHYDEGRSETTGY
jgi:hypothetical protein